MLSGGWIVLIALVLLVQWSKGRRKKMFLLHKWCFCPLHFKALNYTLAKKGLRNCLAYGQGKFWWFVGPKFWHTNSVNSQYPWGKPLVGQETVAMHHKKSWLWLYGTKSTLELMQLFLETTVTGTFDQMIFVYLKKNFQFIFHLLKKYPTFWVFFECMFNSLSFSTATKRVCTSNSVEGPGTDLPSAAGSGP